MFLPLGDDVEHRTFPLIGIFLIVANVLVFTYMLRLFNDDFSEKHFSEWRVNAFVEEYGLVPADLAEGKIAGLVTHMFLHADIWHILGNMLVLWAFVQTLESALGYFYLLFFYFFWGILGGLVHAAMYWDSDMPLIGASGAIAGMIGAYCVAFGPMTKIKTLVWFFRPFVFHIPASAFVALWLGIQLLGVAGDEAATAMGEEGGGIAFYAHLGGFLAGALTMTCVRNYTKGQLVRSVHGHLHFEDVDEQAAQAARADAADQPDAADAADAATDSEPEEYVAAPDKCPHCGTPLSDENAWAPNLLRCPNPECQRMIYLNTSETGGGQPA